MYQSLRAALAVCACFVFSGDASAGTPRVADGTFCVGMTYRSFTPKEPHAWRGSQTHPPRATNLVPPPASAKERARDLSSVIDSLLGDATFGARLDAGRIGAAGFSLGGYTMIEIAGGITEPPLFIEQCNAHPEDQLCQSPPEFSTLLEDFKKLM